jgi:hypothetical protein
MAMETLMSKSLVLSFEDGQNKDGKPMIKNYTYSNIIQTSTPDDLLKAAEALASLYNGLNSGITTIEKNDLV